MSWLERWAQLEYYLRVSGLILAALVLGLGLLFILAVAVDEMVRKLWARWKAR